MTDLRLMPPLGCENDVGGRFTVCPVDSHGTRRVSAEAAVSYASAARPAVARRAAQAEMGATPRPEGLVRARGRARFHTPAPTPWGRSLPSIPGGKAVGPMGKPSVDRSAPGPACPPACGRSPELPTAPARAATTAPPGAVFGCGPGARVSAPFRRHRRRRRRTWPKGPTTACHPHHSAWTAPRFVTIYTEAGLANRPSKKGCAGCCADSPARRRHARAAPPRQAAALTEEGLAAIRATAHPRRTGPSGRIERASTATLRAVTKPLPRGFGRAPLASRVLCPWWVLVSSLCSRIAAYGSVPKGGRAHGQ